MHRSAVLRWTAAAFVAVVTSFVVASDLAALHRRARSLGPERDVVVADGDLALGATVTDDDLTTRKIHESQLPSGVAGDLDEVRGRVVVVPVLDGTFVTARHLAPPEREGLEGVVPVGSRAVQVSPVSAPPLRPGEVVDVLSAFDTTAAVEAHVAARGALVVQVDERADFEGGADVSITLLVTASEAARVAEAAAVGVITVALAAPEEATADR